MKYYVRPTVSGENFTAGKLYEIQRCFGRGRVVVLNDAKEEIIVRCDGIASARLNWRGRFERVSIDEYAVKIGVFDESCLQSMKIKKAAICGEIHASASPSNEYAEVLEKLREILRVPEGENILTHAKVVRVLADGLINLQK